MPIDLIIPFGILFIIVFYLMYSRATFEKKIVDLYEEKYENWKKNSSTSETVESKELMGLIFKTGYKVDIELLDEKFKDRVLRGKFDLKVLEVNKNSDEK